MKFYLFTMGLDVGCYTASTAQSNTRCEEREPWSRRAKENKRLNINIVCRAWWTRVSRTMVHTLFVENSRCSMRSVNTWVYPRNCFHSTASPSDSVGERFFVVMTKPGESSSSCDAWDDECVAIKLKAWNHKFEGRARNKKSETSFPTFRVKPKLWATNLRISIIVLFSDSV